MKNLDTEKLQATQHLEFRIYSIRLADLRTSSRVKVSDETTEIRSAESLAVHQFKGIKSILDFNGGTIPRTPIPNTQPDFEEPEDLPATYGNEETGKCRNVKAWKCGSAKSFQHENVKAWKPGNAEMCKRGSAKRQNVSARKRGSMEAGKCRNV